MKENKRQAIHKRQHTAQPVTHKTLEKLYYIISCRFFFFPAFRKNGKISCIECSICCCSLSLTLPPRAQYYTVLSNFLFCLSLCYFGRRVENRVGFVCVSVNNFIQHSYIWSKILLSFPFASFLPIPLASRVYMSWLMFGPERLALFALSAFCTGFACVG